MAILSNTAMAIAVGMMLFVLLTGPTPYIMGGVVQSFGEYFSGVIPHGFRTFTFMDDVSSGWFQSWTSTAKALCFAEPGA